MDSAAAILCKDWLPERMWFWPLDPMSQLSGPVLRDTARLSPLSESRHIAQGRKAAAFLADIVVQMG